MQVYIHMGTHLAEMQHCLDRLAAAAARQATVTEIFIPDGLDWQSSAEQTTVTIYDPDTVLWVLDPDMECACHIVVDPRQPLIPQLEQLANDLGNCLIEPVKILTHTDCVQAESSSKLQGWLDACIYYSDIVLLGNRSDASKSFVREFQKQYERRCYPCLFMFSKGKGAPADIGEILIPGTRRLSHMFDSEDLNNASDAAGFVIESSCDLDLREAEIDPFRMPSDDASARHVPDASKFVVLPDESGQEKP